MTPGPSAPRPQLANNQQAALFAGSGLLLFITAVALALTNRHADPLPPTCGALAVRQSVAAQLDALPVSSWHNIRVTGSDLLQGHRLCRAIVLLADGERRNLCYAIRRNEAGNWHVKLLVNRGGESTVTANH